MNKVKCELLVLCHVLIGSYAGLVPFIDKCVWSDKACLLASSQKAVPYFAKGIPDLGMSPLDPMNIGSVTLNEGGLTLDFTDTVMVGASKCQMLDVERNIDENWLKISIECPIDLVGKYKASGQLLTAPVEGDGPFHVKTDNIHLDVKIDLESVQGSDGEKHWKLKHYEHTFDVKEKALLQFDNLFNGNKEKADAINALLDQSWKELVQTIGKPFIDAVIDQLMDHINIFTEKVAASELEI